MRRTLVALLMSVLVLSSGAVAAEKATIEPPAVALARAFVELMESGYPGPTFHALEPWALLRPLDLLKARATDSERWNELKLRSCLLATRVLRATPPQARKEQAEQWSALARYKDECALEFGEVHDGHASFCAVAALESAGAGLSPARWQAMVRRCGPVVKGLAALEARAAAGQGQVPEALPTDAPMNKFERRYESVLRASLHAGEATTATSATDEAAHLTREELLYQRLQAVAAGEAEGLDDLLAGQPPLFADRPDGVVMRFAAEALARAARAFAHPELGKETVTWLIETGLSPTVLAGGEPALAVSLAFLWAMVPEAEVFDFLDRYLGSPGVGTDSRVLLRAGLEVLFAAARRKDVEQVQQAVVLLQKASEAADLPEQKRFEAEFFLRFAQWLDARLSGRGKDALRKFQDQILKLHARIPPGSEERIRALVTLNLLATTASRRPGFIHDMEMHLKGLETRNTVYHILWVNQFLEQRQTARAQAVVEWCKAGARRPAASAACFLWDAYYHELIGEAAAAHQARDKADELLQDAASAGMDDGSLLLLDGERRVGFVPFDRGMIRLRTSYSPAFYLIPLPRLAPRSNVLTP